MNKHSRVLAFKDWLRDAASTVLHVLDWLVAATERLLVLCLAGFVLYFGYLVVFGKPVKVNEGCLKKIAENWKATFAVFLIPLFYRTVRTFLEKARKLAGIEAGPPEEEESPEMNPPSQDRVT